MHGGGCAKRVLRRDLTHDCDRGPGLEVGPETDTDCQDEGSSETLQSHEPREQAEDDCGDGPHADERK